MNVHAFTPAPRHNIPLPPWVLPEVLPLHPQRLLFGGFWVGVERMLVNSAWRRPSHIQLRFFLRCAALRTDVKQFGRLQFEIIAPAGDAAALIAALAAAIDGCGEATIGGIHVKVERVGRGGYHFIHVTGPAFVVDGILCTYLRLNTGGVKDLRKLAKLFGKVLGRAALKRAA